MILRILVDIRMFANKMFLIAYGPSRTCRLYHQPYVWSFTQEFFLLNFEICELVSIRFRSQISITNHNLVGCFYKDRTRSQIHIQGIISCHCLTFVQFLNGTVSFLKRKKRKKHINISNLNKECSHMGFMTAGPQAITSSC